MDLFTLKDLTFNDGSRKKKKRISRGDRGKSSGRGMKGQKARTGVALKGFQGGQTPIERRLPKQRTFYVKNKNIKAINLKYLDNLYIKGIYGKIDKLITLNDIKNLKLIKNNQILKLIGVSKLDYKIESNLISKGARASLNDRFILI